MQSSARLSVLFCCTVAVWLSVRAGVSSCADAADGGTSAHGRAVTQHEVTPILLRRCTMCHGPEFRDGGLDLRTRAAILRGGASGPALVPGKPDESRLVRRVRARDCPPEDAISRAGIEPMKPEELRTLETWIALGAPQVPERLASRSESPVSDDDRQFWSFQPPRKSPLPVVAQGEPVRNPLDAFLLAKLNEQGLGFSPEADRLTLLRRASFDLTGLPPAPEEVERFLSDDRPDAYERLIDRLIASPRYGERWGRFWLDLAGYADSEGKRNADTIRPWAWRYRDYVVRSLNEDKPYDRFLLEQIAGDELVDYADADAVTPETIEALVATGFLRLAPDGTAANPVNRVSDRIEVISDETDILARGILGLTMNCARCHDHKYDPIPQRDYYRFVAIFKGAYDEYDWMTPQPFGNQWSRSKNRFLTVLTPAERRELEMHNRPIERQIEALESESQSDDLDKARRKEIEKQLKSLKSRLREPPKIRALWDRGRPSPTYVYRRGDEMQPTRLVQPGVPAVLSDGEDSFEISPPDHTTRKTGRRLALARWLTRPDHPLTARVFVNRVWKHHFGTGIVQSLDNFGRTGTPPSHPELLDWLAVEFVENGWSVKHLHRLIMTSSAYRQSSVVRPEHERLDPGNRLVSRMPMRRMDAEQVRDAILLVAGRLDERAFGEPDPVTVRKDGLVTSKPSERGWRRSLYVRQRRKEMPTILETFDLPQMNPNCSARKNSTVVSQPLHLLNNAMIHELAAAFAARVAREASADPARQIERAYLIGLSRPPADEELELGLAALKELAERWTARLETGSNTEPQRGSAPRKPLADLCHALINSAAFLYVD